MSFTKSVIKNSIIVGLILAFAMGWLLALGKLAETNFIATMGFICVSIGSLLAFLKSEP